MKTFRQFLLLHFLLTLLLALGALALGLTRDIPTHWPWLVGLIVWLGVLTAGAGAAAWRTLQSKPRKFLNGVLGGMMIKMLLSLLAIGSLAAYLRTELLGLIIGFFLAYGLLTGFEVGVLLSKLRQLSKGVDKTS